MAIRFRLGADDAAKYPSGDEWFEFDKDGLYDLASSELIKLETAMNYTLAELEAGFARRSTAAMRAALWIGRRLGGVNEQFDHFDPKVWRVLIEDSEPAEGDAVPPPSGPDQDSE